MKNVLAAQAQASNTACVKVAAELKARVFNRGEDATGSQIGSYSTKPIYVSIAGQTSQVRRSGLKPRGKKKGETKAARSSKTVTTIKKFKGDSEEFTSKTKRERKTMYFPDGYAGFRAAVGRQNTKVDLFLTGDLATSINPGKDDVSFISPKQTIKGRGLEAKYKRSIFAASPQEIDAASDIVEKILEKAFYDSFK